MTLFAPAKITPVLKINKKDKTKKHKIKSICILWPEIYNKIEIKEAKLKQYICCVYRGKRDRKEEKRIQIQLEMAKKILNINIPQGIYIKRTIPYGSGLGGSATDVAAIIKYCMKDKKINRRQLKQIATAIGSDVPFFLSQYSCAIVSNYGDVVKPFRLCQRSYKIIDSNKSSSSEMFNKYDEYKLKSKVNFKKIKKAFMNTTFHIDNGELLNDFEQVLPRPNQETFWSGNCGTKIKIQ